MAPRGARVAVNAAGFFALTKFRDCQRDRGRLGLAMQSLATERLSAAIWHCANVAYKQLLLPPGLCRQTGHSSACAKELPNSETPREQDTIKPRIRASYGPFQRRSVAFVGGQRRLVHAQATGRDKYFAIFAEIDHFVMAITAAKAMVRLCVAHLELICTGGLRCVRPLCSLLPPHA